MEKWIMRRFRTSFETRSLLSVLTTALAFFLARNGFAQPVDIANLESSILPGAAEIDLKVTAQSLLPKDVLAERIKHQFSDVRRRMAASGRTPKEIDTAEDNFRKSQLAVRQLNLKISFDAGHFLYSSTSTEDEDISNGSQRTIVYYNGKFTFSLLGRTLRISSGKDLRYIHYFPLISSNLLDTKIVTELKNKPDDMPAAKNPKSIPCNVFVRRYDRTEIAQYVPGYCQLVSTKHGNQLSKAMVWSDSEPIELISLKDHMKLGDWVLAKSAMHQVFYDYESGGKKIHAVDVQTTYRITKVSDKYSGFTAKALLEEMRVDDPVVIELDGKPQQIVNFRRMDAELMKYFEESDDSLWLPRITVGVVSAGLAW
jgi:hypothetical protein